MILRETRLAGAYLVEFEPIGDERGYFARTFDHEQFAQSGLDPHVVQCSISFNSRKGTLRGMHYQAEPNGESKLIRVTRGAIYDVIIDLRPESATFKNWFGIEVVASGTVSLYVPPGLAHGFQTLADDTEVHYQMSHVYVAHAARGVRYDDPAFGVRWPEPPPGGRVMSERDRSFAAYVASS